MEPTKFDYDLNIYPDLLDLIFNMSILNLDMFVLSFDMFLLICYQSDLNFDQFDLNFGQIIYSYSGQFASMATTASRKPLKVDREITLQVADPPTRGHLPAHLQPSA
jgi:hypothetical protein